MSRGRERRKKGKMRKSMGQGEGEGEPRKEKGEKDGRETRRFALASVPAVMCCQPDSRCAGIKLVHRHRVLVLCG